MSETNAYPAPLASAERDAQRDKAWIDSVLSKELTALANLPEENHSKGGSEFFNCLLRIASASKGTGRLYYTKTAVFNSVLKVCEKHSGLSVKEVNRQLRNAWKHATPRYRK